MPEQPLVSVIVPARDAASTIGRTLDALARQELDAAYEVIVVDDGSLDATLDVVAASRLSSRVVHERGLGPARARNHGVAAASGRVLAFTDADCEPAPDWLAAGLRALDDADLVQGAVRPPAGARVGPFDRTLWVGREALYETANLFVARGLFDRLGGFESWLGPSDGKELGEDVWLGWGARRLGARTAFCPDARVAHAVFARGPVEFAAERARLRYFPAMAARIPELRRHAFYRHWFLSRRSATFDLALAGAALAAGRRSPAFLAAVAPYAALAWPDARRWGRRRAPGIAAAKATADLVGCVALLRGSIQARTLLL